MSCDYRIEVGKPFKPAWTCYNCGHTVDLSSADDLEAHAGCADTQDGREMIPLVFDFEPVGHDDIHAIQSR